MIHEMPAGSVRALAEANWRARTYNGFPADYRASSNAPQRTERYDRGRNPIRCCMTGYSRPDDPKGAGYIFTHLEDYRRPLDWYPMSKRAHYLLHRRFIDPIAWLKLVIRNYEHGAWFTLLTMDVRDMYQPFDQTYPYGLPGAEELWPALADEMGISEQSLSEALQAVLERAA